MAGKAIISQSMFILVALSYVLLAVACTASDSPPLEGAPTPSANAGAMMLVEPPEGGTPIPVHLYTPEPIEEQADEPTKQVDAQAFAPEATKLAQRDPPVLTLEGSQLRVPFSIKIAEYLPEGYELDPWIMMLPGPMPGSNPRGVAVRYISVGKEPVLSSRELMVEQYLAEEGPGSGGLEPSAPEMVGDYEAQVYEIPEAGIIRMTWRDSELGVNYDAHSSLDLEDTLRIVRSFK